MEVLKPLQTSKGSASVRSKFAVELRHVKKARGTENEVYTDLAFQLMHGTFVAAVGPIGSGKTTLVNLIAGLEEPSSGSVVVEGTTITGMGDSELSRFRALNIGLVPQVQNLFEDSTVYENVELPLHFLGKGPKERASMVGRVLGRTGLGGDADRAVGDMSVGERQLVSIARALVCDPPILILDEPTEALDPLLSEVVLGILRGDNLVAGKTIFVATHDRRVIGLARRTLVIKKSIP
jgi:putative ABC transport system ATP-binding protein